MESDKSNQKENENFNLLNDDDLDEEKDINNTKSKKILIKETLVKSSKLTGKDFDYDLFNNLMQLIQIPYFGVYSNDYTFFTPIKIFYLKNPNDSLFSSFPFALQKCLWDFKKKFKIETNFFNITLDGTLIMDKYKYTNLPHYLRVNCALHSYIFYNINQLRKNEKYSTNCFVSLFTEENLINSGDYIIDTGENDGLRINPNCLINSENKKEIILHDDNGSVALSPNNMAFLLDLKNEVSVFYLVCVKTYNNNFVNLLITKVNIFMNPYKEIFSLLINSFNSLNSKEHIYKKENKKIKENSTKNVENKTIKINELKIKYELDNWEFHNSTDKISIENFLTEILNFENLFQLKINFLRGFILQKIYKIHLTLNKKFKKDSDNSISVKILVDTILTSIKYFFEILYDDQENENEPNYDINEIEYKNFEEFYPEKIFNFFKGKSLPENSSNKNEFYFFKFFQFIENSFKISEVKNFGENLFLDYINNGLKNNNFFYLNFMNAFFQSEFLKIMKICDSYREYFNAFGLEINLTKLKIQKGNKFGEKNEILELNPLQCKYFFLFLVEKMQIFVKNFIEKMKSDDNFRNSLSENDTNFEFLLVNYCTEYPLNLIYLDLIDQKNKGNVIVLSNEGKFYLLVLY